MLGSKENAVWAKSKLPPKECKPIKSILKQSNALFSSDPPDTESPVRDTRDFPRILEDLVRGLASPSISSRLDAYVTLNGCLKAYKDVPAPKALEDKVSLLAEFIRRDLTETKNVDPKVKDEDSARKTQLATEAVRLLTALVFSPTILDALPDSFQTFILNQTITVISSKDMPKGLVNQYMYLLTVQNFRTKSMNNERAGRILTVLNDIDQSVKGRQVLAHRLSVYRKLVTQAKVLMISRCRDWMHHLIGGMFSSAKEIRIRAIALGYEAGQALGSIEQVSKAMREVFDQEPTEEQSPKKYADVLIDRLTAWVKSEESIFVPQIWSVVVLFFKGKPQRLERWAHLSPWLKVIQLCFNSSDPQLKNYANRAWNKLIYIVSPNGATSAMLSALLQKPIRSQLSRHQATDIDGNQKRQYRAYTTYCTLLYFAFRPGTDYNTVDRYWQEYVKQMLAVQPRNPLVDPKSTCRILVSLFGESRLKVWNEDRANDATPIKPDDLPRLDAKWVRLRASSVLATLEVFLSSGSSETWWNTENCDPLALRIWNSFTKAVGEAGSKEIKVTMETMTALAEIIGTIKRLYIKSITAAGFGDKSTTLRRFSQLVEIAVTNLGSRAFCEKRLLQSSKTSFQAAETPSSSRSAKVEGVLASPVLHLLNLLTSTVDDLQTGVAYREAVGSLLGVALQSTTSRRSKLVVLRDVSQYALSENPQSNARIILWEILAQSVMDCIEIGSTDKIVNDSSQQLAQDFTEVIKILEVGAQQGGLQATATWARILESNNLQVHKEAGPAGSIVAVIEPLSRFLCSRMAPLLTSDIVELSAIVLENAVWIDDRKDLDRAKRVLWGIAPLPSKTAVFNPFDYLYSLITDLLTGIYSNLSNIEPSSAARALSSLGAFVASAPISLVVQCLKALQLGIAIWVQDLDKVISTVDGDARIVFRSVSYFVYFLKQANPFRLPSFGTP